MIGYIPEPPEWLIQAVLNLAAWFVMTFGLVVFSFLPLGLLLMFVLCLVDGTVKAYRSVRRKRETKEE